MPRSPKTLPSAEHCQNKGQNNRCENSRQSTCRLLLAALARLGEAASFETVEAEIKEIDGTQISVATPSALYKLKKGTVRL